MELLLKLLMVVTAIFMIILVLVQRGRGGGLAGALGGMGGHSVFGSKAGDTFTRVTIGVAAFWICLCAAAVRFERTGRDDAHGLGTPATGIQPSSLPGAASAPSRTDGDSTPAADAPAGESTESPAAGSPASDTPPSSTPPATESPASQSSETPAAPADGQ